MAVPLPRIRPSPQPVPPEIPAAAAMLGISTERFSGMILAEVRGGTSSGRGDARIYPWGALTSGSAIVPGLAADHVSFPVTVCPRTSDPCSINGLASSAR
jgi:hypothetical protein